MHMLLLVEGRGEGGKRGEGERVVCWKHVGRGMRVGNQTGTLSLSHSESSTSSTSKPSPRNWRLFVGFFPLP